MSATDPTFVSRLLESFYASDTCEAVIVMDAAGIVRGWSRSSEILLGWTPDEAIGLSISEIFTPEDRDRKMTLTNSTSRARKGTPKTTAGTCAATAAACG